MFKLLPIKINFSLKGLFFTLVGWSLINPVMAQDVYWYGFSWGGMSAVCAAYKYDQMSRRDAKSMVESFLEMGRENINNRDLYLKLKNLQTQSPFIDGCENLISY